MATISKTRSVATPDLIVGDVVVTHGVRLQLVELTYAAGTLRRFSTDYLGTVDAALNPAAAYGQYGADMMGNRWAVQGNEMAAWAVEA
jgi:hypothetical protein